MLGRIATLTLSATATSIAHAGVIDFEGIPINQDIIQPTELFPGVTVQGFGGLVNTLDVRGFDASIANAVFGIDGNGQPITGSDKFGERVIGFSSFAGVRVIFATPVVAFAVDALDGSTDRDDLFLTAFDATGVSIAADTGVLLENVAPAADNLSVVASPSNPIASVEFFGAGSSLFFDNLTFTFVPEPGVAPLAALGLAGLCLRHRPRATA